MTYIFMIAGKGSRLQPLTLACPKSMYMLDENTTVFQRMVNLIRRYDSDARIVAVTGFMHHMIEERVPDVEYVYNPFYAVTNSMGSLWCAREFLEADNAVLLNGDIVVSESLIRDVICQLKNQDTQLYNYIASHNGFTLCDVVSYDGKHNEANGENNLDGPDYNYSWNCGAEGNSRKKAVNELRKNQIFNAFFLLLFAQGMPCILSGDEFMNTQKGNNNAYCQDNLISWLDWNQLSRQEELYTFVCRLIALRKACMKQTAKKSEDTMGRSGIPQISYHGEDAWQMPAGRASRQLGVFYHEESTEKDFYIAYNMHWLSHSFALPSLPKGMEWVCIAGTKEGVLDEKEAVPVKDKKVQLEERTIKVFVGRQAKE